MTTFIALLRGINVGGHNKIAMPDLRASFERRGFQNVATYINSGNILFGSNFGEEETSVACEALLLEDFRLNIPVCLITAAELTKSLAHAPPWWNQGSNTRHDAIFVLAPMTAKEICARVGPPREGYEQIDYCGRVIFWSAPLATYSRTRWSKITKDQTAYRAITVRSANTALRLARLTGCDRVT